MPCYHPLTAWKSTERSDTTGKYQLTFNPHKALDAGTKLQVPCGQCIGCRLRRSEQWGMRCMHEARMHSENCCVTLTFDDEHVAPDYSVRKRDWQLFVKNLRYEAGKSRPIRYFGNGEYGDDGLRPHHHGLLFGWDFPDKRYYMERKGGPVWKSELLDSIWGKGICEIGSVTHKSAAYVARYCLKKITGDRAEEHYRRRSPIDGQVHQVEPEFLLMSRRPGIGATWFDSYASDAFSFSETTKGRLVGVEEFLIDDAGHRRPVPAYYLSKLEERRQVFVKRSRKRSSIQPAARANATPERLAVREEVRLAKVKRLKRSL